MLMMALLKTIFYLVSLAVGYSISFLYGMCFVKYLIFKLVTNPSNRFWKVKNRELPPDFLNDADLGNHAYIQIKNVKLHYVEKGDRSKPLMLCVHGFPEFWYSWRHQLKEFSTDYWVVAVDMRGYGDSEKPVGRGQYQMDLLIADLKHLITALGREKVTLVAHDWGGIIAWFLVLLEPHLVDSYVVMNAAHPIAFHNVLRRSRDQFRKSWYVFFFQMPWLPELLCTMDDMAFVEKAFRGGKSAVTKEVLEAYKFTFGKPGAFTFPINYYRANFMLGNRNRLKGLGKAHDFPAGLILYGDQDMFLSSEIQEESVKQVVNARLVYIKGASHFVQQDDPTAVNTAMRKFFGQLKSKVV